MLIQSNLFRSCCGSSLVHGFFDRSNGVSDTPFRSLNISYHVGDDPELVWRNRAIVKKKLKFIHLVSARQVHGSRVAVIDKSISEDVVLDGYDGMITQQKGVGLMVQQADCQAILLFDPIQQVVGALHNGWRGSVANIISSGVQKMVKHFNTDPAKILAAISPSLGPCCAEFINHQREFPSSFQKYQVKKNYFDFWQISTKQLIDCGVMEDKISINGMCSCCHPNFFSYRSAVKMGSNVTGRNCSVIGLSK